MRKIFLRLFLGFAIFISGVSSVYAVNAGSELVFTGSRNSRKIKEPSATVLRNKLAKTGSRSPQKIGTVWKIGAFLPLTGPYVKIGLRFKHGLELALLQEKSGICSWQLDLIDSAENTPAQALAAFKNHGVDVILGPIQSSLVQPMVQIADPEEIPLILLAPQPEFASSGRGIFQHFLSAGNEALAIVGLLQKQQTARVALLHPENNFGNLFSQVFTKECKAQTITLWKNLSYSPKTVDFSTIITGLRQPQPPKPDNIKAKKSEEIPIYPFSALIIADFWSRLRLIVPQLAFFGVEEKQLYATNRGSELNFEKKLGRNLDGIIFIDSVFHSPQPSVLVQKYKKSYSEKFDEPASIYDAYAYDTVLILRKARELMLSDSNLSLTEALLKLPTLDMITGITSVSADGVFVKKLCPLTYQSGKLVPVQ